VHTATFTALVLEETDGTISAGHARVLLSSAEPDPSLEILEQPVTTETVAP